MSASLPQVGSRLDLPTLSIDPDAIAANVRRLRGESATPMIAVVKADGFGHGARAVAEAALSAGASMLGVASLPEAMELSALGAPVLTWLNAPSALREPDVPLAVEYAIGSVAHLDELTAPLWSRRGDGARARTPRRVHLFADLGMSRDGCEPQQWPSLVARALRAERAGLIRVVGVMGHLGCTDPEDPHTHAALRRFRDAVHRVRAVRLRPTALHLAGTAAALDLPQAHHTMIRPGAGLVGIDPVRPHQADRRLTPVARLCAPVVQVRHARAGDLVGYGHHHRLVRDTWLGLVALGYADGVPGTLNEPATLPGQVAGAGTAERGVVGLQIAGRRCPLVGQVSMDQIVVDLGPAPVAVQTAATVFGPGDGGEPTVADWADWSGRRPHEILTALGGRIRRNAAGVRTEHCSAHRIEAA